MNYWVNKLTSRKLWVAIAAFVSGLIVAFKGDAETAEVVSGIILQGAAVLGYLLAEGLVDAKGVEAVQTVVTAEPETETEPPDEDESAAGGEDE